MKKFTWVLLAVGTLLCCQYAHTLAAVILLFAFIGIVAVLWVRFLAEVLAEEMAEKRYQEMIDNAEVHVTVKQSIVCGKGYDA